MPICQVGKSFNARTGGLGQAFVFRVRPPLQKILPPKIFGFVFFSTSYFKRAKRAAFPEINGFLWLAPKKIRENLTPLLSWWDCTMMYEPILAGTLTDCARSARVVALYSVARFGFVPAPAPPHSPPSSSISRGFLKIEWAAGREIVL